MREYSRRGLTIILITHNFGIVKGFADSVAVMYRGRIVETGTTEPVFEMDLGLPPDGPFEPELPTGP